MIVDDEPLARQGLRHLLELTSDFEVAGESGVAELALTEACQSPFDVIFLDIRMPGIDGINFMKKLREHEGRSGRKGVFVVLVTAFENYAVQAYEYDATDYLMKPFSNQRFEQSLNRLRRRLTLISDEAECSESTPHVEFKSRSGLERFRVTEILWIESMGHYIMIHAVHRKMLSRATISETASQLEPHGFVQVHRNFIVNRQHICKIQNDRIRGPALGLRDGSWVSVSRRRWSKLRSQLSV